MDNAYLLAQVMGPVYLVMGLSLLLYVKPWQKLIKGWASDHIGLLPFMMMYLILGLIAVNMYNVWEWNVWLLVTLTGWGLLVKSVVYFLAPGDFFMAVLSKKSDTNFLYFGGLVATVIGAALCYYVYYV